MCKQIFNLTDFKIGCIFFKVTTGNKNNNTNPYSEKTKGRTRKHKKGDITQSVENYQSS